MTSRRDFLKSLGALGLTAALPVFAGALPAQYPKGQFGQIYRFSAYGVATRMEDWPGSGSVTLMRGQDTIIEPIYLHPFGGVLEFYFPPGGQIIHSDDFRMEVTPFIEAHTVVYPIGAGLTMPMAYSVENVGGVQLETWTPLRRLDP